MTGQASVALALRKLGDRVYLLNLLVTQLKKKVRLALNTQVVQAFLLKNSPDLDTGAASERCQE